MYSILPHHENPVLRAQAKEIPISEISGSHIQTLIREMKRLLAEEKYGVALAAPQVGVPVRLFIVADKALSRRASSDEKRGTTTDLSESDFGVDNDVYINPVLVKMSRGKKDKHEGCLSIRGSWGNVPRAEKVTIQALNARGEVFTRGASGFLAHIFQHELDHLDGILYTDKATEVFEDPKDHV